MTTRTKIGIGVLVVLLAVGGIITASWLRDRSNTQEATRAAGADASVYKPGEESTWASTPGSQPSKAPSKAPSAKKVPAGCMNTLTEIVPTTFSIDSMKVKSPMLSLGEDESGAAAAPPKDASHTVGWWKNGPRVGSSKGHAVLTIHTYRHGGALGNELYDPKSGFKVGDLVKMTDAQGRTQCYTMEKSLKLWVKDYDPESDLLYNDKGAPRAVIVICWDFNGRTENWDSRILFYLKPVAA